MHAMNTYRSGGTVGKCTYYLVSAPLVQSLAAPGPNRQEITRDWANIDEIFFDILLTVHLNIFILILTNLMH